MLDSPLTLPATFNPLDPPPHAHTPSDCCCRCVSVAKPKRIRFAWGATCCYEGIFNEYLCFNPDCSAVKEKHAKQPER